MSPSVFQLASPISRANVRARSQIVGMEPGVVTWVWTIPEVSCSRASRQPAGDWS
ncbi:TPA_asm: UL23.5 uORF [Human alphaherpesvirus 1]|nr:TPA_asm: UL23.5 uORF [Human alphaherpesvirus 1]